MTPAIIAASATTPTTTPAAMPALLGLLDLLLSAAADEVATWGAALVAEEEGADVADELEDDSGL